MGSADAVLALPVTVLPRRCCNERPFGWSCKCVGEIGERHTLLGSNLHNSVSSLSHARSQLSVISSDRLSYEGSTN